MTAQNVLDRFEDCDRWLRKAKRLPTTATRQLMTSNIRTYHPITSTESSRHIDIAVALYKYRTKKC